MDNKIKIQLPQSKTYQNMTILFSDTKTYLLWESHLTPFTSENIEKFYRFGEKIGIGTFSVVNSGHSKLDPTQKVAIKSVDLGQLKPKEKALIMEESLIIRKLNHTNIIKYIDSYEDFQKAFYVFELVEGGDLLDYVVKRKRLSEIEARLVMTQLFSVVSYLFSQFVLHRDLKPENIMVKLNEETGEIEKIKLIDFGFATFFDPQNLPNLACGTLNYAAPEVLLGESYEKSSDIFSCGVILYFL